MNRKLIVGAGIFIGVAIFALVISEQLHMTMGAVIILLDLVVVYSYTTRSDRDIPEELHDSFEEAYEEEINENFLENKSKTCLICGTENNINRKYCRKCNNLIQNITCPVCGVKNPHTAKYCSHCDSILQNKTRS
jgi:RNA polymerase subunit RPABC4/transcription elongation factor Spt4